MTTGIFKPFNILPLAVLTGLVIFSGNAIAYKSGERFGQSGQNGTDGAGGLPGQNGFSRNITADGTYQEFDLSGKDGAPGRDGRPGTDARRCNQPEEPDHDLWGAVGGNGGNGGNGGSGGNGGGVTIFYQDPAALKQINLNVQGGQGGQGGQGERGGYSCECEDYRWRVNYCEWDLYRRPKQIPVDPATGQQQNADDLWEYVTYERKICQGFGGYDRYRHTPSLPRRYRRSRDWAYEWRYQGITRQRYFECEDGEPSQDGKNGQAGTPGRYGQVTLVPRDSIPQSKTSHTSTIADLVNQEVELVKNIWVNRSALASLLHPSSQVPDRYTFLEETVRRKFELQWQAEQTMAEMGVADIGIETAIKDDQNYGVAFSIPGTLETKTTTVGNKTMVAITGGFNPDRVRAFQAAITTPDEENPFPQLTLEDRGQVKDLLQGMNIKVTCATRQSATGLTVTPDYRERNVATFSIVPQSLQGHGLTVADHTYTIDMARYCAPWLKPGYDVQYSAIIDQTTVSGSTYQQTIGLKFVMP